MRCATARQLSTAGCNQRLQRCKAKRDGWLEALRILRHMKERKEVTIYCANTEYIDLY